MYNLKLVNFSVSHSVPIISGLQSNPVVEGKLSQPQLSADAAQPSVSEGYNLVETYFCILSLSCVNSLQSD